ncbi:MAG: hypothetical protein ACP5JG_15100 [Anaerolineae bacterium]
MADGSRTQPERSVIWRLWNAFKNLAIIFSFLVNFLLVMILLLVVLNPAPVFEVKNELAEPLLVDLDQALVTLGETEIETTVYITDTMPVVFDLPLDQTTDVILTQPVPLDVPAMFVLPGGGGSINGSVSLNLPEGQRLPVSLSMSVPVSTTVPVVMRVPVEIPLAEAGMAPAIEQLRAVLRPVMGFVQSLPGSPKELLQGHD